MSRSDVRRRAVGALSPFPIVPGISAKTRLFGLGPTARLLDVGAGRGWPGLYLAASTGCRVVLSDVPAEAVVASAGRAQNEGLAPRAVAILASARHLPFSPASFDAVVHTDVLC